MVRPPREPLTRSSRAILIIFLTVILSTTIIALYVTFFTDAREIATNVVGTETASVFETAAAGSTATAAAEQTGTPAAMSTAPADVENVAVQPFVARHGGVARGPNDPPPAIVNPLNAQAAPLSASSCVQGCLVRVSDTARTRQSLAELGVTQGFVEDDVRWFSADAETITFLATDGLTPRIVRASSQTLDLYLVRAPTRAMADGATTTLPWSFGLVIDQVDDLFLVQALEVPPVVTELTDQGYDVEKVTPLARSSTRQSGTSPNRPNLPNDLWTLAEAISQENLTETIGDLQRMGAPDNRSLGTRHYGTRGNAEAAEYLYYRFAELDIPVWYEEFITWDGRLVVNVVAEIPGRDASQTMLVLGHFDSINDGDLSQRRAPGADDNASGVAGMLEIARVLSGYDLGHPVRFLASNAEEVGMQGAVAFVNQVSGEPVAFIGAYNIDAIGSYAHGSQIVLNSGPRSMWLQDLVVQMNDLHDLGQTFVIRQSNNIVADDSVLRGAGIPTVLVARELFGWSNILHTEADTIDTVDMENVLHCTQLVVLSVGWIVAGD